MIAILDRRRNVRSPTLAAPTVRGLGAVLVAAVTAALMLTVPAAASAKLRAFTSPSKTIGCLYSSTSGAKTLRCDLAVVDHPKPKPDSCDFDYGQAFALHPRGRAKRLCYSDTVLNPNAPVLAYGETRRFGPFSCRVSKTRGMRCTSKTGHGFRLSRQRQKLW
jgi:hypothetical protein